MGSPIDPNATTVERPYPWKFSTARKAHLPLGKLEIRAKCRHRWSRSMQIHAEMAKPQNLAGLALVCLNGKSVYWWALLKIRFPAEKASNEGPRQRKTNLRKLQNCSPKRACLCDLHKRPTQTASRLRGLPVSSIHCVVSVTLSNLSQSAPCVEDWKHWSDLNATFVGC